MVDSIALDLIAEVRRLLDVEAPRDPDRAAAQFDQLVARWGRTATGAALLWVAPAELAQLLHGSAPH